MSKVILTILLVLLAVSVFSCARKMATRQPPKIEYTDDNAATVSLSDSSAR